MTHDELRALRDAAPEHTVAAPLIVYGSTGDTPVPRVRAMLDFYTAAHAALPGLLDEIARLRAALGASEAENAKLREPIPMGVLVRLSAALEEPRDA